MPKTRIEKDARVVYYADGGSAPYRGPFPAIVEKVYPVDKYNKDAPQHVDLRVFFGGINGPSHLKTNVPWALEPTKYHYGDVPADWAWPEPETS